jgi:mono/diheme cytochrome c family protein
VGKFKQRFRWALVTGAVAGMSLVGGCGEDSSKPSTPQNQPGASSSPSTSSSTTDPPAAPPEPVVDTRTPEELVAAGRSVYNANCIACHNLNPVEDGALGPAVANSSLELLEARVLRGEYPEGYTPKRPSRVMIPLPHLELQLPELAAYLQSFE